ncbi:MAG: hypothetical protein HW383_222 [Candidatus Magasanikbacteria bacterium]|nr:hypothetical protein [Candidatus Magasanikbacteria bacterium]
MTFKKYLSKFSKDQIFVAVFIVVAVISFIALRVSQSVYKKTTLKIGGETVILQIADTSVKRQKGLSGRSLLPANRGMIFIFGEKRQHAFWMKDMNFPIDILWLDERKIVDIAPIVPPAKAGDLNPPRYYPRLPADVVIELPAGFAAEHQLKIGDKL